MNVLNYVVDEDGRVGSQDEDAIMAEFGEQYDSIQDFINNLNQPYNSEIVETVDEAIKQLEVKVYDDFEGKELTEEIMDIDIWLESNMNCWAGGLELRMFVEDQLALGLKVKLYMWSLEYDLNCLVVAE